MYCHRTSLVKSPPFKLCSQNVCSKVARDDGSRFLDCKTTTTAKENLADVFEAEMFKSFIHVKFTGRL